MTVLTRAEVEAIIAERIAADPSFRETLLADPRGVIADVIGVAIPEAVQVVVHQESLTQIHLTIPSSKTLTDADLELVVGGVCWNDPTGPYPCSSTPPTP